MAMASGRDKILGEDLPVILPHQYHLVRKNDIIFNPWSLCVGKGQSPHNVLGNLSMMSRSYYGKHVPLLIHFPRMYVPFGVNEGFHGKGTGRTMMLEYERGWTVSAEPLAFDHFMKNIVIDAARDAAITMDITDDEKSLPVTYTKEHFDSHLFYKQNKINNPDRVSFYLMISTENPDARLRTTLFKPKGKEMRRIIFSGKDVSAFPERFFITGILNIRWLFKKVVDGCVSFSFRAEIVQGVIDEIGLPVPQKSLRTPCAVLYTGPENPAKKRGNTPSSPPYSDSEYSDRMTLDPDQSAQVLVPLPRDCLDPSVSSIEPFNEDDVPKKKKKTIALRSSQVRAKINLSNDDDDVKMS